MPDEYLIRMIISWLRIFDYGMLDLAVTNKVERQRWMNCLISHRVSSYWSGSSSFILWSIQRKMYEEVISSFSESIDDGTFSGINNPSLHTLSLWGCKITDIGLLSIAQGCRQLDNISLRFCERISDEGILAMAEKLPGIKSIHLCSLKMVTAVGVIAILERCPTLLEIRLCRETLSTSDAVTAIAKRCPKLQLISISHGDNVSDRDVELLAVSCRELRSVSFSQCCLVTQTAVLAIVNNCPELERLSLYGSDGDGEYGPYISQLGVSNETIKVVARKCPRLKTLSIKYSDIDISGAAALANGCHQLGYFSASNCWSLNLDCIFTLCLGLKNLFSITLVECEGITDDSSYIFSGECPELTSFSITRCVNVTDLGISFIAGGCRKLSEWTIDRCRYVTDASLTAIASGCPDLRSITLNECRNISDEGFKALALNSRHLRNISLRKSKISDVSLTAFAANSRELSMIYFDDCHKITSAGISMLATECREIGFIRIYKCKNLKDGDFLSKTNIYVRALSEEKKVQRQNRHKNILSMFRHYISCHCIRVQIHDVQDSTDSNNSF